MQYQVRVRILHRRQHLLEELDALADRELLSIAIERDRLASDILEREIRLAVVGEAGVVEPGDVRVGERRQDLALAGEAFDERLPRGGEDWQLERDLALEQSIGALG